MSLPPKLIHVWASFGERPNEDYRRCVAAAKSWEAEYENGPWISVGVKNEDVKRDSQTAMNDTRCLPFIKDLIQCGIEKGDAKDGDIIALSNDDIVFLPGLAQSLYDTISKHGSLWCPRMETRYLEWPLTEMMLAGSRKHIGADLFAFTRKWWEENSPEYPDLVYACEAWDLLMRRIMQKTGGVELADAIAHEIHTPYWSVHRNDPSGTYNRELASAWLNARGLKWLD